MAKPSWRSAWRVFVPSAAPWAWDAALRALLAGTLLGVAAFATGLLEQSGLAYFGASCAITFSVLGRRGERVQRASAQALGAMAGIALAGITPHSPLGVTVVAVGAGLVSGFVGARGPSATAFSLMLLIGLSYGQFGPTDLPWYVACLCYAIGAAVVILVVAVPVRRHHASEPAPASGANGLSPILNGIRIAICIGAATAITALWDHGHHSFWLPLTVAVVVRAEYGPLVTRAAHRIAGTVAGSILAATIILLLPSDLALVVGAIVAIAFAAAAAPKLYALSVVGITASALLSTEIGVDDPVLPFVRLGDTLVGVVIAVVLGYLVWPRARRA
jgi:hypothetical protein